MTEHVPADLVGRYARGADLPADLLWALEAHLESCAACRVHLSGAVPAPLSTVIDSVWTALDQATVGGAVLGAAAPERRPAVAGRGRRRFTSRVMPSLLPWAAMMSLVVFAALLLDLLAPDGSAPSALLLLAPIVPVLGVGIAWSRLMDPAHDLVASTPRAGLEMVLRRTLAVLSVVMPALFACGWVIGASPAYWLLPCLAVTAVALALSSVVGVRPAALATVLAWAGLVIGPAALTGVSPAVLTPAAAPVWAATLAAGVAAVLLRSARYARS